MRHATPLILLVLLVVAAGINYIDRGSLSVVKTDLAAEFNLDPVQMGLLFSAFFWSYALFQLVAGWVVDRFDVKWVYALGFLVWSLATVGMGVLGGFAVFFALRLALGIGESVAYPATSRVIVMNFPERQRGLANALVDAATKVGTALSLLAGGLLVARTDWRTLFLVTGLGSLLWLPLWLWLVPAQKRPAGATTATPVRRIRFAELLVRREVWGTSLGFFCLGYAWTFLLSWLPSYLEEARGFSKGAMAVYGSLPLWAMAATAILGGWVSDRAIARGASPTRVRKGFLVGGFLLCALFLTAAMMAEGAGLCVGLLTVACASLGLYTSNAWAMTQTLAGPYAAGQWTGLQNAIGNMGGVIAPALTGWLVKETGSYTLPFLSTSAVLVLGVAAYLLLVPRVEPLAWAGSPADDPSPETSAATQPPPTLSEATPSHV